MVHISKEKKLVKIGNSKYIHVDSGYVRAIEELTKDKDPTFRIIGDTVLIIQPIGVELDTKQIEGLLKKLAKPMETKETNSKIKEE